MINVTKTHDGPITIIDIDGLLHLTYRRTWLTSIQAWKVSDDLFCIELSFLHGAPILLEYDDFTKWEAVLEELRGEMDW